MDIKSIIEILNKTLEMGLEESLESKELNDSVAEMKKEFLECSDIAQSIIMKQMSEEDIAKLALMCQKLVVSELALQGNLAMLIVDTNGSLQSYTQTVLLAMIGVLYKEGIL